MPTIGLRVQQDGYFAQWQMLTGGEFGYQVVGDSDGQTHDGDASFGVLDHLTAVAGRISFPLFLRAEGLNPISITIYVAAKRGGVTHPRLQIGFYRAGLTGLSASLFDPTSSYTVASRTFSTNPITGSPWSPLDLPGLEVYVQNESGVNGNNDITLVSGSMDYYPNTNTRIGVFARRGL